MQIIYFKHEKPRELKKIIIKKKKKLVCKWVFNL